MVPSLAAASGDSDGPAASDATQQIADIRPESGVGLFCDIEVSAAPTLPGGSSASAATYQDSGSPVVDKGFRGGKAHTTVEFVPPLSRRALLPLAGLTDHLPLLLAVTIFISRGGIRVEDGLSEQQRRPRSSEDLLPSPKR